MEAEIEVLHPGLFSTIQDMGRFGYLKYGVPISGVMDQYAAKIGNMLLQNEKTAAVMEITMAGPKLLFHGSTRIVVSGADLSPKINETPIPFNMVMEMNEGDVLSFGRRISGCRAYLAVSGGFKTGTFLGSQSWFHGISTQTRLERGNKLSFKISEKEILETNTTVKVETGYLDQSDILAFPGPEFYLLSEEEKKILNSSGFSVGKNANRMAVQLKEEFKNKLDPIITGPVLPGTVQLTPSGRLIILMKDCQTTGGYPRVLQISEAGMNVISQQVMGDMLQFKIEALI
jgi:biotin-dependent carboxylase-like uncharacterized protein